MRFASLEHHAFFLAIETTIADMIVVIGYNFIISAEQMQLFTAYSVRQLEILIQVYKKGEQRLKSTAF